jgi:uncharacterized protein DUF4326
MTPQRVQLRRAKGYRMPPNTLKVCRPSPWGNPFKVGMLGVPDRATAVALFERALQRGDLADDHTRFVFTEERIRIFLGGKNLACWCPLDQPCHADVLLRIANAAPSQRKASRVES